VHKTGSICVLEHPRLWRLSSGSQEAESLIKVPENDREGVGVEVRGKAIRGGVPKGFQKRGEHKVEQACKELAPVDFLGIQAYGDVV